MVQGCLVSSTEGPLTGWLFVHGVAIMRCMELHIPQGESVQEYPVHGTGSMYQGSTRKGPLYQGKGTVQNGNRFVACPLTLTRVMSFKPGFWI